MHAETLEERLSALGGAHFVVLDQDGEPLTPQLVGEMLGAAPELHGESSGVSPKLLSDTMGAAVPDGEPLTGEAQGVCAEPSAAPSTRTERAADTLTGAPRTLLVLGDHQGFTTAEEATMDAHGAVRARVSRVPLLASHSIVLAHAVLDEAALDGMSSRVRVAHDS